MTRSGLLLPVLQSWSCHNCGGCCREHEIGISTEEKRRIEQQNWSASDGITSDRPLVVKSGAGWRLSLRDDGACVFLDEKGLCRIHAKYGEAAKPLACRTYPYALHPAASGIAVSLRFSCPSVVQNAGRTVTQQRSEIETLAREIVPKNAPTFSSPRLNSSLTLDWPQFQQILAWILRGLNDSSCQFATRLIRTLNWLSLLDQVPASGLSPDSLPTLLRALYEASQRAMPNDDRTPAAPARLARTMFRQFVAQLMRHDTAASARSGFIGRWKQFADGVRFTSGSGRVPQYPDPPSVRVAFPETASIVRPRFRDLEAAYEGRSKAAEELFLRYFTVKLEGVHFCGPAFYDFPLIDGFRSLALMYPAVQWAARLRAARRGSRTVSSSDLEAALATMDHNFGYSPAFGMRASRDRIQQLARMDQVTLLCDWYSR